MSSRTEIISIKMKKFTAHVFFFKSVGLKDRVFLNMQIAPLNSFVAKVLVVLLLIKTETTKI